MWEVTRLGSLQNSKSKDGEMRRTRRTGQTQLDRGKVQRIPEPLASVPA